jgi:hypothetical protein
MLSKPFELISCDSCQQLLLPANRQTAKNYFKNQHKKQIGTQTADRQFHKKKKIFQTATFWSVPTTQKKNIMKHKA